MELSMKKNFLNRLLTVILLLLIAIPANITTIAEAKAVRVAPPAPINEVFSDPALADAIADKLGMRPSDEVTTTQLDTITDIYANSSNITSLEGLSCSTNLVSLDLDVNQISDLTSLVGLNSLTSLSLDHNNMTGLALLVELTDLTYLNLGYNPVSVLTPLASLTNLSAPWT